MNWSAFEDRDQPWIRPVAEGKSLEARAVESFFRGKRRSDVTLESLATGYPHDPAACLAFMTPEAFAFFLPAFMRIALDNYDRSNAIPDTVIGRLVSIAEGEDAARERAMLQSYSEPELTTVAAYLKEMSARYWHLYPGDDANRALSLYWDQFENS